MKIFKLIPLLLLSLILIVFSVVNREAITVSFWPFYENVSMPVFFVFFAGIFLGLVLAWLIMVYRGVRHYSELKSVKKETTRLSREVEGLEGELDKKPPKIEQKNYSEKPPS